jgi:hypothetical protein
VKFEVRAFRIASKKLFKIYTDLAWNGDLGGYGGNRQCSKNSKEFHGGMQI